MIVTKRCHHGYPLGLFFYSPFFVRFYGSQAGIDGDNTAVWIVGELRVFHIAPVIDTAGQLTVMVEEIPLSFILHDGLVGGPAQHGLQDPALIGEGAVG